MKTTKQTILLVFLLIVLPNLKCQTAQSKEIVSEFTGYATYDNVEYSLTINITDLNMNDKYDFIYKTAELSFVRNSDKKWGTCNLTLKNLRKVKVNNLTFQYFDLVISPTRSMEVLPAVFKKKVVLALPDYIPLFGDELQLMDDNLKNIATLTLSSED